MSVRNEDVMDRWVHHVRYGEPMIGKHGHALSTNGSNVLAHGDTLYSYGTHFVLAQANRDARGKLVCLLLNGDRFSVTTSKHQSWTRNVCANLTRDLGVPSIIIPFSALSAAGVNPDDVEPIHVRADRNVTHRHSSREKPGTRHVLMEDPDGRTTVERRWLYGATRDTVTGIMYESVGTHQWRIWPAEPTSPEDFTEYTGEQPPFPQRPSMLDDRDGWQAWRERFTTANRQVPERKPLMVPNPNVVYVGTSNWLTAEFDGEVWRWERQQHLLGDSLFRARVRETVEVKPSAEQRELFDLLTRLTNERQSLTRQIDALDPPFKGRRWNSRARRYRPSEPRNWREVARRAWTQAALSERLDEAQANWSAAYDAAERTMRPGHRFSGGTTWRISRQRTRRPYFLSSFDYQESTPLYFLCELPANARPETVEQAIDALKPPEVVAAEARGITVTRQGDLFAIPTRLSKRQLRRLRGQRRDFEKRLRVLGTNHSVTEGVVCKGGAVFGRGVMRHEPDAWRTPDHARQRMGDGKTWHMLVRNTVPRA
jgi:hypothetical protein